VALDQYQEEEEGMSFLDHLEALRWHILRAVSAVLVFSVALCIDDLPFTIQSRQMTGQFSMHMTSSFVVGIIAAFPYLFWEVWRFISPGLYSKEKNAARGAVFFVSFLFLSGASFGYYILSPLSINFLANYQLDPSITNEFDITSYVSTLSMLVLASAIMFQLPVVVYFLSMSGLVTSRMLKAYRKHSIVVILVLSAVITPPDVISQLLIAMPIVVLYEVGIEIAKRLEKKRALKEAELGTKNVDE
jgi:sec-independent protein translocase protein TatC